MFDIFDIPFCSACSCYIAICLLFLQIFLEPKAPHEWKLKSNCYAWHVTVMKWKLKWLHSWMQSAVNLCTPPQLAFLMLCCYTPLRTVVSPSSRFCWGFCAVIHFDAVANDESPVFHPNDKHMWRHRKNWLLSLFEFFQNSCSSSAVASADPIDGCP